MVYYNEIDPFASQWLSNLSACGYLPIGEIDQRSIQDVSADDISKYSECHFFAGIGGWPYALRLAGWPEDWPVWTGSCPCQPFSAAGKQQGAKDSRHLWPEFRRLIAECRPPTIFGEQVASRLGREWLAGVRADLEALGYAVGCADLCAASVGAPHIRQRLYWMADATSARRNRTIRRAENEARNETRMLLSGEYGENGGAVERLADADGRIASDRDLQRSGKHGQQPQDGGAGGVGKSEGEQYDRSRNAGGGWRQPSNSSWSGSRLIQCLDGKARRIPIEPALFPLVDGFPNRVGTLRGAGNAICPEVAAAFVRAFMECKNQST